MQSRPARRRIDSRLASRLASRIASRFVPLIALVALASILTPLGNSAAAQGEFANGAYERPVYSASFASAATPASSFAFAAPHGLYVSAGIQHGEGDGEQGTGSITLFLDHTGNASCLARFDCSIAGTSGTTFHFTPEELGSVADPRALTAYLQHLDYVAPIAVLSPVEHVAVTPEPDSRGLLAAGLTGLGGVVVVRRRRG